MLVQRLPSLRQAALLPLDQTTPWLTDLLILAVPMEVRIVRRACAVQLTGAISLNFGLSLQGADLLVDTVAHLLVIVALVVKACLVNARRARSTSVTRDVMAMSFVVSCIEHRETVLSWRWLAILTQDGLRVIR